MSAKSVMIVGTMSSSGKSFITAGLCRIFKQDGFKTAPFKSQNMALNSYITYDGLEMGRAQVMQAEAAGIEPDIRMNPILLKPTSESGSQVILNGEIFGTMKATEYYTKKEKLIPYIVRAYNSLSDENDIIVLEGAGSPAEINLKDVDIVNMGMAKLSDSPVILVGDIDRGGVFASIYGTIMLMNSEERNRIKGIIINKFRGDIRILEPGLKMIEELTGVPILGVVPYVQLDLDDEDSLSERLNQKLIKKNSKIDISIIKVPHISNFTDFIMLERMEDVSVRYITKVSEILNPDIIILPGTKNTISDLRWLRQNGLEAAILKQHEKGCVVFGICGGFQMLGMSISDPDCVEDGGSIRGIGLLNIETIFYSDKHRTCISGKICDINGMFKFLSGHTIRGYEIHMGKTTGFTNAIPFIKLESGETDGYINKEGSVFGSYLHGIFDSPEFAQNFVKLISKKKGIDITEFKNFDLKEYKEEQYNKLADTLRSSLDINQIYEIINEWEN